MYLVQRTAVMSVIVVAIVLTVFVVSETGRSGGTAPAWETVRRGLVSTVDYIVSVAQGDLGLTAAQRPVADVLVRTFPKSLGLLIAALLTATAVGLPVGILAALRRHSPLSRGLLALSTVGISAPSFFIAMLLVISEVTFYRQTGVRVVYVYGFGWDRHLVLPTLVLAAQPAAAISRLTFLALTDVLERDYVRTARAKGLLPRVVLVRHILRNAAIPLLTAIGVSLRLSLTILPVVEFFFSWPGVGLALLGAIRAFDTSLVTALVLSLAITFLVIHLLLDISYRALDPRIRESSRAV